MTTPTLPSEAKGQFVKLKNGSVYVVDEGEGKALFAVHGLPGSVRDFRWLASCLESSIRLIRVDMPGFGQTPLQTMPAASFASRADFVLEIADALGIDRFAVLGHSMGGGIAMEMAARHPARVAGLALLASIGLRSHRGLRKSPHIKKISWLFRYVPGTRFFLGSMLRKSFIQLGFSSKISLEECIHSIHCASALDFGEMRNVMESIKSNHTPVLQSWAEDDRLIETAISEELSQGLTEGIRISFSEGGHNIQKTQAVELGEQILAWLETVSF